MLDHLFEEGLEPRDEEHKAFVDEALGFAIPTSEHVEEWMGTVTVKPQTANMRRTTLARLADRFPLARDITRKSVRGWITELQQSGRKDATIQRMLTDCRGYWRYLETIEIVPEGSTPFDRMGLKVKSSERVPWEPDEIVQIHHSAAAKSKPKDQAVADLILLAMYSGARLGEIVNLQVKDVRDDSFDIIDAKTQAGVRTVPIHSAIKQAVARLLEGANPSDFLLRDLSGNNRMDTASKAFARIADKAGYSDPRKTFHSIRKTFTTAMENLGVSENIVADIIGHEKPRITYGLYSGGTTLAVKAEALAKLTYPLAIS